jgi:hypothetical protein
LSPISPGSRAELLLQAVRHALAGAVCSMSYQCIDLLLSMPYLSLIYLRSLHPAPKRQQKETQPTACLFRTSISDPGTTAATAADQALPCLPLHHPCYVSTPSTPAHPPTSLFYLIALPLMSHTQGAPCPVHHSSGRSSSPRLSFRSSNRSSSSSPSAVWLRHMLHRSLPQQEQEQAPV